MVRQDHRLSGREFEQTQEDGEGQGSLACCSHKEPDTTQGLNSSNNLEGLPCPQGDEQGEKGPRVAGSYRTFLSHAENIALTLPAD